MAGFVRLETATHAWQSSLSKLKSTFRTASPSFNVGPKKDVMVKNSKKVPLDENTKKSNMAIFRRVLNKFFKEQEVKAHQVKPEETLPAYGSHTKDIILETPTSIRTLPDGCRFASPEPYRNPQYMAHINQHHNNVISKLNQEHLYTYHEHMNTKAEIQAAQQLEADTEKAKLASLTHRSDMDEAVARSLNPQFNHSLQSNFSGSTIEPDITPLPSYYSAVKEGFVTDPKTGKRGVTPESNINPKYQPAGSDGNIPMKDGGFIIQGEDVHTSQRQNSPVNKAEGDPFADENASIHSDSLSHSSGDENSQTLSRQSNSAANIKDPFADDEHSSIHSSVGSEHYAASSIASSAESSLFDGTPAFKQTLSHNKPYDTDLDSESWESVSLAPESMSFKPAGNDTNIPYKKSNILSGAKSEDPAVHVSQKDPKFDSGILDELYNSPAYKKAYGTYYPHSDDVSSLHGKNGEELNDKVSLLSQE